MGLAKGTTPLFTILQLGKQSCSRGVLLFLLISINTLRVQGVKTRCNSTKVHIGTTSTITCEFEQDLNVLPTNVYVDHRESPSVEDHELVVACQVYSGKFTCRSIPGYEVIGNVTNRLTFKISETRQNHSGEYLCAVLGSSSSEYTSCILSVIEGTQVPLSLSTHTVPKGGSESEGSLDDELKIIIGLAAAVGVLIIALILLSILICYRRKSKHQAKKRQNGIPPDEECCMPSKS